MEFIFTVLGQEFGLVSWLAGESGLGFCWVGERRWGVVVWGMFVKPQISVCVCFCVSSVMFRSWLWSTTGNLVLWCFQHCLFCSELLRLTGPFVLPYECQDCLLSGSVRDGIKSGIASGNAATVLILLTCELGRSFRLLMSTVTSSFHVLEFSLYSSFHTQKRLSSEYSLRSKLMGLFSRFVFAVFCFVYKKV